MNIALWLARMGRAHPDRPALGEGQRVVADYGVLAANTARRAHALLQRYHLKAGDRVAIVAENSPHYFKAIYAIWHAGLCAVPVNARLHPAEMAFIVAHSGAKLAICSEKHGAALAAEKPAGLEEILILRSPQWRHLIDAEPMDCAPVRGDALAWLFYTSGTTGRPKGAMLTHDILAWTSLAYLNEIDPTEFGQPIYHAAPMSHGSGLYMMAHVLKCGINVIPESGGFDPEEIAADFAHWRQMSMFAAPTMIKRLVASEADLRPETIRTIIWGGAPMYVEDCIRALDRFGPRFAQIYGQGESPMTITHLPKHEVGDRSHPKWLERLGSAGRAYSFIDVVIRDEAGKPLPPGETGEITAFGPTVMPGYWDQPEATAKTLRDGYLYTGDVGVLDEDGYLTLKDRSKDLIISGGSNIYPREVEEVLLTDPRVKEVSVIGRPDAEWGEVVVAYVVGQADDKALDALCLSKIARFKRPKDYVFVDALPKSNYGKILKTELRVQDTQRMQEIRNLKENG